MVQNNATAKGQRAGSYAKTGSIKAFRPADLPPSPPIVFDKSILSALSKADRALARLDGAIGTIPDPEMLVYAFMRQEAVLSSQIEGTQASLEDLFEYEVDHSISDKSSDISEVVDYLAAMDWSLNQIKSKPISLNLLKKAHAILLQRGRGANRAPGQFRKNQNWIGPPGCELEDASYVPPSVPDMHAALDQLEKYINAPGDLPDLIQCALIHAQFETIHPFWDGNGRLGRMLITLLLCEREVLELPVLYLSLFFKTHRTEYYERLQAIRDDGQWEEWILFFLRGVTTTSKSALTAAKEIRTLREKMIAEASTISKSAKASAFGEGLFKMVYFNSKQVCEAISVSPVTANSIITAYIEAGYVTQINNKQRDRIFAFAPYLEILHRCADDLSVVIGATDHLATNSLSD